MNQMAPNRTEMNNRESNYFVAFDDAVNKGRDVMELSEDKALYKRIFNESCQFIGILSPNGTVLAFNQTAMKFAGVEADEVIGKPLWETPWWCHSADEREKIRSGIDTASGGTFTRFETTYYVPEKGLHYIDCTLKPIYDKQGQVQMIIQEGCDITERKRAEQYLQKIATHDPLTGLPNQRLLLDRLNHAMVRARRRNQLLAVLFLDLDGFKFVNDSLGHDRGDLLLKTVAERLQGAVRDNDTVARMAGDEFVIILEDLQDLDNVIDISDRIIRIVGKPYNLGEDRASVTASIGISMYPYDGTDPDILIKKADSAMYQVKRETKNDFRIFV